MASDKIQKKDYAIPTNVKIKVEPGTSMPIPIRNIKTEPGISTSTRLTSFRVPRDLTLSGAIKTEKPKRIYTPNINAQRNKKKDDTLPNTSDNSKSRSRERSRDAGRGDRGRNRSSNKLLQSVGIFSEGIIQTPGNKRYRGDRTDRESSDRKSILEKPKLNLDHNVDKEEEEEKLKAILGDDFLDDENELNLNNAPVMLPMLSCEKLYKERKVKEEVKEDICKVKQEEEIDEKPIILKDGTVQPKKEIPKDSMINEKYKLENTISKMTENKTNHYILIQFPDCLPGLECTNDTNESKPKNTNRSNGEKENSSKQKTEYCKLNNLKSGMLGKLQILKSGKARLCLGEGEGELLVDVGSHVRFRQDLVAAKLNSTDSTGDLINLGPVNNTLVCSPDWESMLARL